jgi:hypothetical protein
MVRLLNLTLLHGSMQNFLKFVCLLHHLLFSNKTTSQTAAKMSSVEHQQL